VQLGQESGIHLLDLSSGITRKHHFSVTKGKASFLAKNARISKFYVLTGLWPILYRLSRSPNVTRTKNSLVNAGHQKRRVFEGFCNPKKGPSAPKKPFSGPNLIPDRSRPRTLVGSRLLKQAPEDGMAETAVARPALALHAAIEFWFDPASPARTRRHRPRPLPRCQAFFQFNCLRSGEAAR
jgi:hypothetical protein